MIVAMICQGKNFIYIADYELKPRIFDEVDYLWITGSNA